jgi:hypothetical protein
MWTEWKTVLEYSRVVSLHASWPILLSQLIVLVLSTILLTIFVAAWWTILTDKPSAEKWGIAASLLCVLLCLQKFYSGFDGLSDPQWIVFAIGITGLLVFSRRKVTGKHAAKLAILEPVTGDGTSKDQHLDE